MSYNPFDDLPGEVANENVVDVEEQEEKVNSTTEPASKRQKLRGNERMVSVDVAESKEENQDSKTIKSETPAQAKVIDVSTTLQTLRKHLSNIK